jgi:hypothetical protein
VFTVGALTFGIIFCRDSTFPEPAKVMASRGATVLFVPTKNGMSRKGGPELVIDARNCDVARALENGMYVVRADVAGRTADLVSYGSSAIVTPAGVVLGTSRQLEADLVVAEIDVGPRGAARLPKPRSNLDACFGTGSHALDQATLGGLTATNHRSGSAVSRPADIVAAVYSGVRFVHEKAPNRMRLSILSGAPTRYFA